LISDVSDVAAVDDLREEVIGAGEIAHVPNTMFDTSCPTTELAQTSESRCRDQLHGVSGVRDAGTERTPTFAAGALDLEGAGAFRPACGVQPTRRPARAVTRGRSFPTRTVSGFLL